MTKTFGFFLALFFCGTLCMPFSQANASREQASDNAFKVEYYTRAGVEYEIEGEVALDDIALCQAEGITCIDVQASEQKAGMKCTGQINNGGWDAHLGNNAGRVPCWDRLTFCYDFGDAARRKCYTIDGRNNIGSIPDVALNFKPLLDTGSFSKCLNASEASSAPTDNRYKEYCVWDYNPQTQQSSGNYAEKRVGSETVDVRNKQGLTGATGDDMMMIRNGTTAFLEYVDVGENHEDGLVLISRNGQRDAPMMMPMGPGGTQADFKRFLDSDADGLTVQEACYPAGAEVTCPASVEDFNMPGHCGSAALKNFLFKPRLTDNNLCQFGTPSSVGFKGGAKLAYRWACN